mmetsp:Transcript_8580/g.14773  ORF Transcript_8580/g.14773 Transcript_8580/m.14773 type:complete len:443 (-) Transcript_8580:15-1343(-)
MRDRQDRRPRELLLDHLLDHAVRLQVHGGRRLIEAQDARALQDGPRQAEQLPLSEGEVGARVLDDRLQLVRLARDALLQVGLLQRPPQLLVRLLAEGVQVRPHRPFEHDRLLRQDGERASNVVKTVLCNVLSVDDALARVRLVQAEQRQERRRLARARPADNAHLLAVLDRERDVTEGRVEVGCVAHHHVFEDDLARFGPASRGAAVVQNEGSFRGDVVRVVVNALYCTEHRADVGEAAHAGREEEQHLERVGDREAEGRGGEARRDWVQGDGEVGDREDQQGTEPVEAVRRPELSHLEVEDVLVEAVDALQVLALEDLLGAERAHHRNARERLRQVGKDGAGRGTAVGLELLGGLQVVVVQGEEADNKAEGDEGEPVEHASHEAQGHEEDPEVDERDVEHVLECLVDRVHVLGDAVDQPAQRRDVEEEHGGAEDLSEHAVV